MMDNWGFVAGLIVGLGAGTLLVCLVVIVSIGAVRSGLSETRRVR